jgi:hypothetical protein
MKDLTRIASAGSPCPGPFRRLLIVLEPQQLHAQGCENL